MMLLMGCAGTSEKTEEKDRDVVVQVSEGSTVEELFNFTSTQQISISVSGVAEGFIHIGNLENGNSVVWSSDSVFLYVKGDLQTDNKRNGHSTKNLKRQYGEFQIDVPRDRNGEFEPKLIPKYQRDISGIEEKVIYNVEKKRIKIKTRS